MRIIIEFRRKPDTVENSFRIPDYFFLYLVLSPLVIGTFFRQQQSCQGNVLQGRILREEVERLENEPEVQTLLTYAFLAPGNGIGSVEYDFSVYGDSACIGSLKEIEAAKQRCLSASGGSDYGKGLALFEAEAYILYNFRISESFAYILTSSIGISQTSYTLK